MDFLRKLLPARSPVTRLEGENLSVLENPSEEQIRALVHNLQRGGTSFATLTDEAGNYIQIAGSRPWCVIERRHQRPLCHERAYQYTPQPKYKDGAKIRTGAGEITLNHDEWFLLKDAAEIMVAFLQRNALPEHIRWRSMAGTLGLE